MFLIKIKKCYNTRSSVLHVCLYERVGGGGQASKFCYCKLPNFSMLYALYSSNKRRMIDYQYHHLVLTTYPDITVVIVFSTSYPPLVFAFAPDCDKTYRTGIYFRKY